MHAQCAGVNHLGNDLADSTGTNQAHVHLELLLFDTIRKIRAIALENTYTENFNSPLNTLLSIAGEGVEEATTDTDSRSAKCDGLEDIACTTDTTINEDGELGVGPWTTGLQSSDDVHQVLKTRSTRVQLTTTVVREDDTLDTSIISEEGILWSGHTLENDGHLIGTVSFGCGWESWEMTYSW